MLTFLDQNYFDLSRLFLSTGFINKVEWFSVVNRGIHDSADQSGFRAISNKLGVVIDEPGKP